MYNYLQFNGSGPKARSSRQVWSVALSSPTFCGLDLSKISTPMWSLRSGTPSILLGSTPSLCTDTWHSPSDGKLPKQTQRQDSKLRPRNVESGEGW